MFTFDTITIDRLAAGGDGIGYIDGKVCFVPFGVPGDTLKVKITNKNKKFLRATIDSIENPSPHRSKPVCPLFTHCGGCGWLHISSEMQMSAKKEILQHALRQPDIEVIASPKQLGYRFVVRLHAASKNDISTVGFFHTTRKKVVPIDHCPILAEPINDALSQIAHMVRLSKLQGEVRMSLGKSTPVACFSSNSRLPEPFYRAAENQTVLRGITINSDEIETTIFGSDRVDAEGFDHQAFWAPAASFGQANPYINRKIAETIDEWIEPGQFKTAQELFAGAGNHTMTLAPKIQQMWVSEIDSGACAAMTTNLQLRGYDHVRVSQGEALETYTKTSKTAELLILNPPRVGHHSLSTAISKKGHKAILYISCNPATLARDLAEILPTGYNITRVKGFDMFPQTAHMEAAVLLEQSKPWK